MKEQLGTPGMHHRCLYRTVSRNRRHRTVYPHHATIAFPDYAEDHETIEATEHVATNVVKVGFDGLHLWAAVL